MTCLFSTPLLFARREQTDGLASTSIASTVDEILESSMLFQLGTPYVLFSGDQS